MSFASVRRLDTLWSGELVPATVQGRNIVLLRQGDVVHAYLDRCAHLGLPINDATLEGGRITCAVHGWCYDARTGVGVNPKGARLVPLPVKIAGGEILVGEPEDAT